MKWSKFFTIGVDAVLPPGCGCLESLRCAFLMIISFIVLLNLPAYERKKRDIIFKELERLFEDGTLFSAS